MKYRNTTYLLTLMLCWLIALQSGFAGNSEGNSTEKNTLINTSKSDTKEVLEVNKVLACSTFTVVAGPVGFCSGDSITLDAGAAVATRLWSNGKTTQTITLKASDIVGAKDTIKVTSTVVGCTTIKDSVEVNVYSIFPVALFDTTAIACAGAVIPYTNKSTITPTSALTYKWTFSYDASDSTSTNPTKGYLTAGTYSIRLIATSNLGCKDTVTQNIVIKANPVASFTPANASGCMGTLQTFNNTSTVSGATIDTCTWSFGDGNSTTKVAANALLSVTNAYSSNLTYGVSLRVSSNNGCSSTAIQNYIINPSPVSNFSAANFSTSASTNFTNASAITPSSALTYQWTFGELGATSTLASPTYTYTTAGTHTAQLISTSTSSCKDTSSQVLTIEGIPVPNYTYTSTDLCALTTLSFTNTSTIPFGAMTYAWDFGDGEVSTAQNPTKKFYQPGSYTVKLVATGLQGGTASISKVIVINPLPVPAFDVPATCLNGISAFTNNTTVASGTFTNAWTFGDGNTSAVAQPSHQYAALGTYQVKLIATSNLGCIDSTSKTLEVAPTPSASFTSTGNVCLGKGTDFTNTSTVSSGTFTNSWNLGNGTSSTELDPSLQYYISGTYTVTLVVNSGNGCKDTATGSVQIFPNPITSFSSSVISNNDTVYFANQSTLATSYSWNIASIGALTITSPKVVFASPGKYLVTLQSTSADNCVSTLSKTISFLGTGPNAIKPPVTDTVGFFMKGSNVYVEKGTELYVNGTIYNDSLINIVGNTVKGIIWNRDSIHVAGNINNRIYKKPLFTASGEGAVIFRDGFLQYVRNDSVNFNSLVINKFQQNLTLQRSITVGAKLVLREGTIDYVHNTIDLLDTGMVVNETSFNYLNGVGGWIIARNRLISPSYTGDVSSLGLIFNPSADNLGLSTIYRRNHSQYYAGEGSLNRFFDVKTSSNGASDLVFNYFDSEWQNLPKNQNEPSFKLWYSDTIGFDQSSKFINDTTSIADPSLNKVTSSNTTLSNKGTRITVSDSDCDVTPKLTLPNVPVWFCNGDSVTLDAGTAVNSWKWSTGQSTQTIKLKASNITGSQDTISILCYNSAGCKVSKEVIVQVYPKPNVTFICVPSACFGKDIVYTNTSNISPSQSLFYVWTFADGSKSTELNPVKTYATTGTFTTKLVTTSAYGCKDSTTKNVLIQEMPKAKFTLSDPNRCVKIPVNLTNSSTIAGAGAIARSEWTFGDGFTSAVTDFNALDPEMKAYSKAGNYTIKLKVTSNATCVDSVSQEFVVNPLPVASFTVSGLTTNLPTTFNNTSTITNAEPLSYNWSFGESSATSILKSPVYTYTSSQAHSVELITTSLNSCKDTINQSITTVGDPVAAFTYTAPDFCTYSTIAFTDQSTIDVGALTYSWSFGDGTVSTLQNPTKKYDNPGTYTVALTATSISGGTNTTTKVIVVLPVPVAKFTVNPVCLGKSSTYTNSSTISSGTFTNAWTFGDSQVSSAQNPTNIYATVNNFNTKLKITSALGCVDSSTQIAVVNPLPVANFTVAGACFGTPNSTTNLSTLSAGTMSYAWTFGNSTNSSEIEPFVTYAAVGSYTVNLIVSSNSGCTASLSKTAQVYQIPVVKFSGSVACNADTTYFTNQSTIASGTLTYLWTYAANDTSSIKNPKKVFPNANTYTVVLQATSDKNCVATTSKLIDVKPLPVPNFTTNTVCIGQGMNFTNTSGISAPLNENTLAYAWNFGNAKTSVATNPTITYTNAQSYTVTLTAESMYGCLGTFTKTVLVHALPTPDFTVTNVCSKIPLTFTNTSTSAEAQAMTYVWNFNDGTTNTDSIPSKTYSNEKNNNIDLTATTAFGCSNTISKTVSIYPIPVVGISALPTTCINQTYVLTNNTTIKSGTFTNAWDFGNSSTASTLDGSATYAADGNYTISLTATSDKGCIASATQNVAVKPLPVVDFTTSSDVNGNILFSNLTTVTPTESINYNWSFGNGAVSTQTNPTYKYFNNGIYTVVLNAITASGCKATTSKSVKYPNVSVADFTSSVTACEGSMVQFTNTSVFSTDTLTYAWDFGDSNNSTLKSPEHTYAVAGTFNVSLTVTPITGAPVTVTKAIVIHALPVVDFTANNICVGNNLNFINNSTPSLGSTYAWELGDGTTSTLLNPTQTYLIATNYSAKLTVTTAQNCKSNLTKSFTVNALPVVDLGDTIRTCGNAYTLNAANVGSSYLWSTSETTQTINVNAVGLYKVMVTNTNTCQASDSVVVVPNSALVVNLGFDKNVCENAVLDAKNQGATYLWSNGETTQKLLVGAAGDYSVVVTDANNCKGYDTVAVGLLPSPTPIHLGNDTAICDEKPLVLDVAQANATFLWLSGSKTSSTSITASGVYGVKVSYQNGCSSADTIQVTVKHAPIFTLGKDTILCANNLPYRLNARSRSISYLWSDNSTDSTLSVVNPGTYFVKVVNNQSCSVSDTVTIGVSALPVVALGSNASFCKGDSLTVDAGNVGGNYLWSNGKTTQTLTVKNGGVYNVTVTNASGCKANGTIQLNEKSVVKPNLGNDLAICSTAFPKTITATAGYNSYSWIGTSNITNQIAVTGTSTLVLEVKDINNCVARDTMLVNSLTVPTLNLGADTAFCKGNNFKLDAQNAGAIYDWSTGATTQQITVSTGGTYAVKVTAPNGCTASAEKNVAMNFSPSVYLGNDKVLCKGQSWTLNASNSGATYAWSTGETTQEISVTATNTYIIVLTDKNQCKATDQILVTFEDVLVPFLGVDVSSCKSIVLDAGIAATSYLWSTNETTRTITATASGEYVVSASSPNNCIAKDTVNVAINAAPIIRLGKDSVLCQPSSLVLAAGNAGAKYLWSTNQTTEKVTLNQSGTYIVSVTNVTNCSASDTINLTFNPITIFDLGDNKDICKGTFTTLTGPGISTGTSLLWSTGEKSNLIQVNKTGTYILAYTNDNQCVSKDTVNVIERDFPVVKLGNDTSVCDKIQLDAGNLGNTFLWNTSTTTAKETINRSGQHWVKVTSPYQCATSDTIKVTVLPKPSLTVGNDVKACKGDTTTLSLTTNASSFQWNTGATTSSIGVVNAGTYSVVAQSANGCVANDTLHLSLLDKPVLSLKESYVVCGNTGQKLDAGNKGSNYSWTSTTGLVSTQQVIDVKDKGFYYLKITNVNACTALDTVEIQMSPNAVYANFLSISVANVGDTVKMINLSYPQPFTSKWSFGDGLTSTETDPVHTYYMDTTVLTRKLTVTNGVCSDTKIKTIKVYRKGGTTSKSNVKNTEYIVTANVYPNPSDGRFLFESELVVEREMQLDLYDLEGHVLMSKHYPQTRFHHALFDEREIKSGMYFLRMIVENQSKIFKIIIVR